MRISFIQGIVSYPTSNNLQQFLLKNDQNVSLSVANGPITITLAHKNTNYLFTETVGVDNAWTNLPSNTYCWLYWDINQLTAVRTFGFTTVEPTYGAVAPTAPTTGLHWFDTTNNQMYVYESGAFRKCIRVFAARVIDSTFSGLGTGDSSAPYAGSQVRVYGEVSAGRIVHDDRGSPITRSTGEFFTTEDQWFVDGTAITALRLESAVLTATALENIAKFQVVKYSEFGKVNVASYNDSQDTAIAIMMEDALWNETGAMAIQGVITNPDWSWSAVGVPLWISGTQPGFLTTVDAHVADPLNHPISKSPVARVLSPTQVYFDQGLGGKGDKGDSGGASSMYASATVAGVTRLSINPTDAGVPIAVGNNDPRISQSLLRSGGTMYGPLQLASDPLSNLHAATKQYVDAAVTNAADSTTLTTHINNTSVHLTGDTASWLGTASATPATKIGYLNNVTADIQQQLDVLTVAAANVDQGATSITVQGAATGYWQTTPLNPTSALLTLTLRDSGVVAGSYNTISVGSTGVVVGGTNIPYLDTSQDATLSHPLHLNFTPTSLTHAVNKQYVDSAVLGALPTVGTSGTYLTVTTDAFGRVTSGLSSVTVTGDLTGSINSNTNTSLSLTPIGTAGTYRSVTTDAKGRVISGSNPSTLAGYNITDAVPITGATMTGALTLVGTPTADLHAATKKYVDDYVANATSGGNVHNGLLGLQGGLVSNGDHQYYHLTSSDYDRTVLMCGEYLANSNAFMPASHHAVLSSLTTNIGLPYVTSTGVVVSNTINVGSTSLTLGFGNVDRADSNNVGNPVVHYPTMQLLLNGTAGSESVTIQGLAVPDPYGTNPVISTEPKLLLVGPGSSTASISLFGNTLRFGSASTYTFDNTVNLPTASLYANSVVVSSGTVSSVPPQNNSIVNKQYVDESITTALAGSAYHNDLGGIQGGSTTERYHLTSAQVTTLDTIGPYVGVLARRDVNNAFTASQSFGGYRIQAVGTPTASDDATTKAYVDASVSTSQLPRVQTITNANGTVAVDWSLYDEVRITMAGDIALVFSNANDGQRCMIKVKQDAVGNHAVTLPGTVRFSTDAASYTATTTALAFDRLGFVYDSADARYDFVAIARGYA